MKIFALFFFLITSSFAAEIIRSYDVPADSSDLKAISREFEFIKKRPRGYEVYVLEEKVPSFLKLAPKARLLEKNIHHDADKAQSQYRKYANVESDLMALTKKYSSIASLLTYGATKEGRKLYALKIATGGENKPKLMITAATHGDELITTEVLFVLINELLEGQGKDSRLTKMLNGRDLYFIPVVSPDSFEARERYVQGLDPNRSYPWPEKPNNPSVDVIKAMMDFTNAQQFNGSLDLHAYGRLVMYPWAYTKTAPEAKDEVLFKDMVLSMARENNYKAGQISTTIYVAPGSSADYFYWKNKTMALAAELGNDKIPAYNKIPLIVKEAREMVWTFVEHFN